MMEQVVAQPTEWDELLAAARQGDDFALGQMCERFRAYLLLLATSDLGDDLRAKLGASDVVQQAMLDVCRDFETFRGNSEAEFRSWIKRLVQHNLIDTNRSFRQTERRKTSRETPIDQTTQRLDFKGDAKTASSILQRRETDEQLLRAISRLPEKHRRIVELRHRDGLSYAEIAAQMGMTEAAARKLWSRTLQSLRSELTVDEATGRNRPK